jgi:hypothetical protein
LLFGDNPATRVEAQGKVASAVFDTLNQGHFPLLRLMSAFAGAGQGRHLLAWSSKPALESLWARLGVQGSLAPDGLMLNVENNGVNKLDWYIDPTATLTTARGPRGTTIVRLRLAVPNPYRDVTSDYIEGDGPAFGVPPFHHRVILALYLPAAAFNVTSVDPAFFATAPDGPMKVAATRFDILLGTTRSVSVQFSLPSTSHELLLLPSGRIRPIRVAVSGSTVDDGRPVRLRW